MDNIIKNLNVSSFLLGGLIAGFIGATLQNHPFAGTLLGVALWAILYVLIGWRTVDQNTVLPIERFGIYVGYWPAGPAILCFPGLIDREKKPISLAAQRTPLYVDDNGEPIQNMSADFKDMSAPVRAEVWWEIDPSIGLEKSIKDFLYTTEDAIQYIGNVCDAGLRPAIQSLTIDEVRERKEIISKKLATDTNITTALRGIGVRLHMPKGIFFIDVILSKELEEMQNKSLKGKKEAEMARKKAEGYAMAIADLITAAGKDASGKDLLSWDEARDLYFRNRGLEAYEKSGANSIFFGQDIASIVEALIRGKK